MEIQLPKIYLKKMKEMTLFNKNLIIKKFKILIKIILSFKQSILIKMKILKNNNLI
jgi:hypothetical protein